MRLFVTAVETNEYKDKTSGQLRQFARLHTVKARAASDGRVHGLKAESIGCDFSLAESIKKSAKFPALYECEVDAEQRGKDQVLKIVAVKLEQLASKVQITVDGIFESAPKSPGVA